MSHKARVLVVDDEQSMREFLEIFFRGEGYDVTTAADVDSAMIAVDADDFDVVISDIQMPERSGLDLLHAVKETAPQTVVIMITAFATTETAITAMKQGAYDYVTKPFKVDELRLVVEKALEKRLLSAENQRLKSELRKETRRRQLVGNGRAMEQLYELVARVANTKTNVLVCGESGTGKELVARAIHDQSERRDQPFVAVNCGAIPENLLESELFGHVKGAFTGAVTNKAGLFETAHKGTLFLDEIGELPPTLQVKLLRVIQDKAVRRVGGTSDTLVDVRIIAATNRRLEEEVAASRFREDLYYRLNVIQIGLPPLRDRTEDIPLLVTHFLEKYALELGKPVAGFSEAAMERLLEYGFPGNVRELENMVERAVALSQGGPIGPESLPPAMLEPPVRGTAAKLPLEGANLDSLVNEFERGLLREALRQSRGVKKRAAQLLGISFRSFRYRLEKLGMEEAPDEED
ncbi:MAG TPA: sigma-54 dependent transcriptional regulator [Myxococcota bacterium]|nr:sigma-54 dependent transcriptional regulator [Myxococcota bacterium]